MAIFHNISNSINPANGHARFEYIYSDPDEIESEFVTKLTDLETGLCIFRTKGVVTDGFRYWIGLESFFTKKLSNLKIEFIGKFYQQYFLKYDNEPSNFILDGKKFFPHTNGDPAFQTFLEVEVYQHYDYFGIGVEQGDVVVDIGANYGFFSLHAIKKGAAKVLSFEPFPETFDSLLINVANHDSITPIRQAISNYEGLGKIISGNISGSNFLMQSSENVKDADKLLENNPDVFEISTTTLDNVIKEHDLKKIDFLKVDCEGSERDIFKNLSKEIFEMLDKIVIEYHSDSGKNILIDILEQNNFSLNFSGDVDCGLIHCKKKK
jgi:FkbM family methyltransferase